MRDLFSIRVFTHALRKGDRFESTEHRLELPRLQALQVLKTFFGGDGRTSVHVDTLRRLTPEERKIVEA